MKDNKVRSFLFSTTKPHIIKIIILALLQFLSAGLSVLLALVSKNVIDSAVARENILIPCLILGGVILLQITTGGVSSFLTAHTKASLDITLKSRLFYSYISKDYSAATKYHSGEIINRLTSDIDTVISGIVDLIPNLVGIVTRIISSLAVMIYFSWSFAVAVLCIGLIAATLSRFIGKKYKKLHKNCQTSSGRVRSFMQEASENLLVVKTFSGNESLVKRVARLMKADFKNKIKRAVASTVANTGIHILFTGGYYITLAWGALRVAADLMSFGSFTAFLQIVSQVRNPFMHISGVLTKYYAAVASAERIAEIEALQEDTEPNRDINEKQIDAIEFKDVTFSYEGGARPLDNANAKIRFGEITTLIGSSGSGKSTTFRLLLGLYEPTEGEVSVNEGDKSTPISAATRWLFNYVPQGNLILSGTIGENIAFFDESVSRERLIEAAKSAEIYDYISSLPDGFDTVIGERGLGLSEGQLQRIAIARALILDAPVLLLDECTSALDSETESKILGNIRNMKTKTVIIITHRMKALEISDSVLRVENGKIVKEK